MQRPMLASALLFVVSACVGTDGSAPEATASSTVTTTTITIAATTISTPEPIGDYVIEHDPIYVGDSLGTHGNRRLGDFKEIRFTFASGAPSSGDVILFRRATADGGHEDLVVVRKSSGTITDGLLLTGDTTDVWLGVACGGTNPIVLLPSNDDTPLRAWRVDTDWQLTEIPPSQVTDQEAAAACRGNRYIPEPDE